MSQGFLVQPANYTPAHPALVPQQGLLEYEMGVLHTCHLLVHRQRHVALGVGWFADVAS